MGRGLTIMTGLLLSSAVTTTSLAQFKVKSRTPSQDQLEQWSRSEDCLTVGALSGKLVKELASARQTLKGVMPQQLKTIDQLEKCADTEGAQSDEEAAAACPNEYEDWVNHSYKVMMLEDEIRLTQSKYEEANTFLQGCPRRFQAPLHDAAQKPTKKIVRQ